MKKTQKGGCILINVKDKTIGLVYREQYDDYSFPKGHLEEGETLKECAIRETNEETKRACELLKDDYIYIEEYRTPRGEEVEMYYFLAKDIGPSDNTSTDTHPTVWIPFDEVYDKLTYPSLKEVWNNVKGYVREEFDK